MMNYSSAVSVLAKAGYRLTNKCHFNGETYHDFNYKGYTTVSLVIDDETGAVIRAEVTKMHRDMKNGGFYPGRETIVKLQDLMDKFAPRETMSL